jgi:chemotaxis protein methyltransferase CheR
MDRDALIQFANVLTRDRAGVILPPGAEAVEMRLGALARREGLPSVWTLLASIRKQPGSPLAAEAVEALAPRDTWFFRDRAPFQRMADSLLEEAAESMAGPRLRIWCAGCGAGQEPYSVAMLLEERRARARPIETEIVATDFSRAALRRAQQGLYDQFEAQRGLSIRRLVEHFDKDGEDWRINAVLRRMVEFKPANLIQDFAGLGNFDIILLRHVLPHMAVERRSAVLMRVAERLRPGGFLVLGPWETALGLADGLDPVSGADGVFCKLAARVDRRVEPRAA